MGFPTWSSSTAPCPLCKTVQRTLFDTVGLSAVDVPHDLVSIDDYNSACSACEHTVVIRTTEDLATIAAALRFDRRKGGARG
eukprot:2009870-Alexandrium_andersonii.AAC.1